MAAAAESALAVEVSIQPSFSRLRKSVLHSPLCQYATHLSTARISISLHANKAMTLNFNFMQSTFFSFFSSPTRAKHGEKTEITLSCAGAGRVLL